MKNQQSHCGEHNSDLPPVFKFILSTLPCSSIPIRPITPRSLSHQLREDFPEQEQPGIDQTHVSFPLCCRFPRVCCRLDGKGQGWLSHSKGWSQLWLWQDGNCWLWNSPQQEREVGRLLLQPQRWGPVLFYPFLSSFIIFSPLLSSFAFSPQFISFFLPIIWGVLPATA